MQDFLMWFSNALFFFIELVLTTQRLPEESLKVWRTKGVEGGLNVLEDGEFPLDDGEKHNTSQ